MKNTFKVYAEFMTHIYEKKCKIHAKYAKYQRQDPCVCFRNQQGEIRKRQNEASRSDRDCTVTVQHQQGEIKKRQNEASRSDRDCTVAVQHHCD